MQPYGCHSLSPLYLPSVNNHLQESLPVEIFKFPFMMPINYDKNKIFLLRKFKNNTKSHPHRIKIILFLIKLCIRKFIGIVYLKILYCM